MADIEVIEKIDTTIKVTIPKLYKVVIHNDNTTTFDFVIAVLVNIFHHPLQTAQDITHDVHHNGKGVAGLPYTLEVAEEKKKETTAYSRANGFPLTVTIEEL